jgi:hypothetical protein
MRPAKHHQGTLTHPLNDILGTEASVRVLRAILLSDIPIGIAELARLTSLQASGLPTVCARLEDLGVIETVGRGRSRQFRRSPRSSLANPLANAFTTERSHAETVMMEVRQAVQGGASMLRAAWIEGPVARNEDHIGDAIIVVALARADDVEQVRLALWGQLLHVQETRDVAIELRVETEADLVTSDDTRIRDLERALPLVGAPPIDLARPRATEPRAPRVKTHEEVDVRLLRMATAISDRIRTDASLIEAAIDYINRRALTASGTEQLELREWKSVLTTKSVPRIRRLLVEDSARGRRLRQSFPFTGVFSSDERDQLLRDDPRLQ